MKKYYFIAVLVILAFSARAQQGAIWHSKKCAVALTYDDALNVDLDNAIPLLDSLKLKATFYLSGYSGVLHNRLNEWRAIAKMVMSWVTILIIIHATVSCRGGNL